MKSIHPLSTELIEELMGRYYAGERVSDLIREFGLIVSPPNITSLFPKITLEDVVCQFCNVPMTLDPPSRAALCKKNVRTAIPYCQKCGHQDSADCLCSVCVLERQKRILEIECKQRKLLDDSYVSCTYLRKLAEQISIHDAVSLVSLTRVGRYEDTDRISALCNHAHALCCRPDSARSIVIELYMAGYLDIASNVKNQSTAVTRNNISGSDITDIEWQLVLGSGISANLSAVSYLEKRLHDFDTHPTHWVASTVDLWRELALEELLAYLELRLAEHHFAPCIGEKTRTVLLNLLNDFPIYKIYNFIWGAVTNAAAYQVRSGVSRQQAANTVVGNCQKKAERAKAEGWNVKDYKRDPRLPGSARMSLFANVVTGIGERVFSEVPN